jgi:uncharacterized SAM-binding protein YcdF (DUF218 family)
MFLLKKIVSALLCPVSLCLEILILGLFCLWATRRQRWGKILVTLGTLFLLLLSFPVISSQLLIPLERRYPALLHPETVSWGQMSRTSTRWIVVLGGGIVLEPRLPANSQISEVTLARLVEGVRLYKALPGSKLLLSGGKVFDPVPEARLMAKTAILLGVKPQDIGLESDSRDTAQEARNIAKMISKGKFILVTSAAHMPRALAMFKKVGLEPIPAPTNYLAREAQGYRPNEFLPRADSLEEAADAMHEYLGLAWAWLRGEI